VISLRQAREVFDCVLPISELRGRETEICLSPRR